MLLYFFVVKDKNAGINLCNIFLKFERKKRICNYFRIRLVL